MADGGLEGAGVEGEPTVDEAESRRHPHLTRLRRVNALSMRLPTFPIAVGATTASRLSAESGDTLLMDMMEVVGYR